MILLRAIRLEAYILAKSRALPWAAAFLLLALGSVAWSYARLAVSPEGTAALCAQVPQTMTAILLPLLFVMHGAAAIAVDANNRTLALLLASPLGRFRVLAAKTLVALGLVFCAVALCHGVALAAVAAGLAGSPPSGMAGLAAAQAALVLQNAYALCPTVLFGVFVGVLAPRPAPAMLGATGAYLLLDILKNLLGFAPAMFTSSYDVPFERFHDQLLGLQPAPLGTPFLVLPAAWMGVLFLASLAVFRRKGY